MNERSEAALPPSSSSGTHSPRSPLLLLTPLAVCYLLFFVAPLATMAGRSLLDEHGLSLASYRELFGTALYLRVIWTTFKFALWTTAGCLLLGYPVAMLLTRTRGTWRNLLLLLVLMPYWLDFIVRSYAWMILLGRNGAVNRLLLALGWIHESHSLLSTDFAVAVGMVQVMLPLMILSLYAGMRRIDPELLRAAAVHGAGPWGSFRAVFLPLSAPGIVAGSLLTFVNAIGFYVTPALLGGPKQTMISQTIDMLAGQLLDWPLASAVAVLLLVLTLVPLALLNRRFGFERAMGGGRP
jgi:ABC-type spermidine/putrescine transport system permease subunit I